MFCYYSIGSPLEALWSRDFLINMHGERKPLRNDFHFTVTVCNLKRVSSPAVHASLCRYTHLSCQLVFKGNLVNRRFIALLSKHLWVWKIDMGLLIWNYLRIWENPIAELWLNQTLYLKIGKSFHSSRTSSNSLLFSVETGKFIYLIVRQMFNSIDLYSINFSQFMCYTFLLRFCSLSCLQFMSVAH